MASLGEVSRTAKLWIQYMEYINVIKMSIAGERTGNWLLHLDAISKMLNLFAITGHTNYAKSALPYHQMMRDLPTDCVQTFTRNSPFSRAKIKCKDVHWSV